MNLRSLSLLLTIFLLVAEVSAQENYHAGIIFHDADTVRGVIDYRNWKKNPAYISFREALSAPLRIARPGDIAGFAVEGDRYISGVVKTDVSPIHRSEESDGTAEPLLHTDTVFLRVLVAGEKSLLQYVSDLGRQHFYIETAPGVYTLLVYHKYNQTVGGSRKVFENNRYHSQLATYLSDCPGVLSGFRNLPYKEAFLRKLFSRYYACRDTLPSFVRAREKTEWGFGLVSGLQRTSLKFTGFDYLEHAGWNTSLDFTAALFAEATLPRNMKKWSFYSELMLSSYSLEGQWRERVNAQATNVYHSSFSMSYAKINTMVRFRYPVGAMRVFAGAGLSNGFLLRNTNLRVRELTSGTTTHRSESPALNDVRRYEQALLLGVGVVRNGFSLEARMEQGNGFSPYAALATQTRRFFFLVGYRF